MLTIQTFERNYPVLSSFRKSNPKAVAKQKAFTKSKGGWRCGDSFIPKKSKCYTDPVTGKKLKEPTTYNQYRKKRAESVKRKAKGQSLTDKERVYLQRVESDREKLKSKNFQAKTKQAVKKVGYSSNVLSGGIADVDPQKIQVDPKRFQYKIDGLFNQVIQGELPESRAVVIGGKLKDHTQQEALVKLIAKEEKRGRRITNDVISELADMTGTAPKQTEGGNLLTLLGFDPDERSLALEKAEISASIKRQLNKDKKLFGTVGKSKAAQDLTKAGNKINIDMSAAVSQSASTTLTLFEKQKFNAGKIDNILNESATRLANGEKKDRVSKEAREQIEEYLKEQFKYGETPRRRYAERYPLGQAQGNARLGKRKTEFSREGESDRRTKVSFRRSSYTQTRNGKKVIVKYTKPKLRSQLKQSIQQSDRGGKPGQWSARKSQLLAAEYKKAGGGYRGSSKSTQAKSLDKWTKQKWRTRTGEKAIADGKTSRYLPDESWNKLTKNEAIATDRKKIVGNKKGKQFVPNTKKAKASFSNPYYIQTRNGKKVKVKKNRNIYGGWWGNRTTSTVVKAKSNSEARSKIKAKYKDGYGKLKKVALLSDRDAELARKGTWVRTRIDGKSAAESNRKSSYRSWLS